MIKRCVWCGHKLEMWRYENWVEWRCRNYKCRMPFYSMNKPENLKGFKVVSYGAEFDSKRDFVVNSGWLLSPRGF